MTDDAQRDGNSAQKIAQIQNAPPELGELIRNTRYARMSSVIMNPRPMSEEERREWLKPPANKYDARWLEIPAFLRRQAKNPEHAMGKWKEEGQGFDACAD